MASDRLDLLTPGQMPPACSTTEFLCVQLSTWHLVVLMTPRNNITSFSSYSFEKLVSTDRSLRRDLCFAILGYTFSERDYCSVSLFKVMSVYPTELTTLATLSHPQGSSNPFFRTTALIMFWCLSSFTAIHVHESSGIVWEFTMEFGLRK